jgi:hypothetical protein
VADRKTPVYSSNTISGLDTQWEAFTNQTITVTDFSDLTWANIEFVDLFTNLPVGWTISNLRFSGKTVTFDGTLPNAEDVKIRATFTDEHGNTSTVADVETLSLSMANQAPVIEDADKIITLNWWWTNSVDYTITTWDVSDDSTSLSDLTLVNKWYNTSKWSVVKSGTTITVTRIDGSWDVDGSPENDLPIAFQDADWKESEVLTLTIENVNDF